MSKKLKYYSPKNIQREHAQYNIIIGERSNGKTYSILNEVILKNYVESGKQGAYLRRWQEDLRGKRGKSIFDAIVANGVVEKITNGKFTNVTYGAGGWYLSYWDDENRRNVLDDKPMCYAFSLSSMEHDKSTSYPNITTILFDEFLTRGAYLPDEFILFMNTISTIVRQRQDVTIYMLGNTVNKYSPYFAEMGLSHVRDMQQGTIDLYTYGKSDLRVAVEYCHELSKDGKPSDIYFAFDNPKLNMITNGVWELDMYPHCPCKYRPKDIMFYFFIEFNGEVLQGEVVLKDDSPFIYIHQKTTDYKYPDEDLIYTTTPSQKFNVSTNILKPRTYTEKTIYSLFQSEKVFYQSNDVGEIVRNYIQYCKQKK